MEGIDFGAINSASEFSRTSPGTIGVFIMSKIEYGEAKNDKKTPFMRVTFTGEEREDNPASLTQFPHDFFLSAGALTRVQYMKEKLTGEKFTDTFTSTESLMAKMKATFEGKRIALKVTGKINPDKGTGFPDIPFGGFAAKADDWYADNSILKLTPQEKAVSEDVLAAMNRSSSAKADKETGGVATVTPGKKIF